MILKVLFEDGGNVVCDGMVTVGISRLSLAERVGSGKGGGERKIWEFWERLDVLRASLHCRRWNV